MTDAAAGLAARLRETTLLGGLEPDALQELAGSLEVVNILGGETVIREGEPGDCLYIVLSGRLRVSLRHPDGRDEVVGEVARGESVGEMAVLTGGVRTASVRAIRDTQLLRLSTLDFDRLSRNAQDTLADASAYASELIGAIRTVQAYTSEGMATSRFGGEVEQAYEAARSSTRARPARSTAWVCSRSTRLR